jgi:hypothetical protein
MVERKAALRGVSEISRVAERGRRGNESGDVRQDLRAQVRKFRVRTFIFYLEFWSGWWVFDGVGRFGVDEAENFLVEHKIRILGGGAMPVSRIR